MRSRDLFMGGVIGRRAARLALWTFPTLAALLAGDGRAALAAEPPPELLEALDRGRDGERVARAAETLAKDYRSHPRASHSRAGKPASAPRIASRSSTTPLYSMRSAGRNFLPDESTRSEAGNAASREIAPARVAHV